MKDRVKIEQGIHIPIGTHEGKIIFIGADHCGFDYKEEIKRHLAKQSYTTNDVGAFSSKKCDCPTFSHQIGEAVSKNLINSIGIGISRYGLEVGISASKHPQIYPVRCLTSREAQISRKYDNTNFLALGVDGAKPNGLIEIVDAWLTTPFFSNPSRERVYFRRYLQTAYFERELREIV